MAHHRVTRRRAWGVAALLLGLALTAPLAAQPSPAAPETAAPETAAPEAAAPEAATSADSVEASPDRPQWAFSSRLIFWAGAIVVMALVGRIVFREQLGERRTLRLMIDRIGPFFPEFDIDPVKAWVHRCAPHVWSGWRTRDMSSLSRYATPRFMADSAARFEQMQRKGLAHAARLDKVLKVHPLGLYSVGDGPPPADVELILRLEQKAIDCVVEPDGTVIEGSKDVEQVQHFWAMRHDGHRWLLDRVWAAGRGEDLDLSDRPLLPPIIEWRRPGDGPTAGPARPARSPDERTPDDERPIG